MNVPAVGRIKDILSYLTLIISNQYFFFQDYFYVLILTTAMFQHKSEFESLDLLHEEAVWKIKESHAPVE